MKLTTLYSTLNILIAIIWLVNGLLCKIINFVPRHEQIVAEILCDDYSRLLTIVIGLGEIAIAIWILTKYKSRLNAITQIFLVFIMNTLEFILVPDLLLWGKFNSVYALVFIGFVYYIEFVLKKKLNPKNTK